MAHLEGRHLRLARLFAGLLPTVLIDWLELIVDRSDGFLQSLMQVTRNDVLTFGNNFALELLTCD